MKAGMARGAAASLALHIAGLTIAFNATPSGSPPPGPAVVEVLWEAAPKPAARAVEPALASPAPVAAESSPAAAEPPRPEAEPPPAPAPTPKPPPRPASKPLRAAAEAVGRSEPTGQSATPATISAATPPSPAAPAAPTAKEDYVQALLRWLEPHRRYPRTARLRGIEGVVRLALTIDRAGAVLEIAVSESSGERLLDRAALEMVERAAPAPPFPAYWPAPQAVFIVPIRFALAG